MPITYTNRKGLTYYLCKTTTKTGKPRYYFAREQKGEPLEQLAHQLVPTLGTHAFFELF